MKEDFDDILRKKWEERQFPVDQSHRADMIRLLDQHNRRRTSVLWWLFGGGIACAVIALIVILYNADKLNDTVVPIDSVTTIEAQAENEAKAHAFANKVQEAQVEAVDENESESIISDEELRHAEKAEKEAKAQAEAKENGEANVNTKAELINNIENDTKAGTKAKAEANAKDETKSKAKDAKAVDKKKEQTIASTNEVDKPGDETNEINANQSKPSDNTVIANSTEINETFVPVAIPNEKGSTTNSVENVNENVSLVVRNNFVTDPIDALAFGNIDFSVNNEIGDVEPVIVKQHPLWLYAEAGMGFVPAPKSNIKSGYKAHAGGGVGYGLSDRMSLTLSGGYMMQKNGFDFQRSSAGQQSGFGARSNFNTLTPDKLHFVYARLGVHYRIKRHMISVYGGGQYLYGAQGTVVVKSEDQLTGAAEKTKYAWLKIDGMNRWWWNAELNYGYQITPRFSIQAGVKCNFASIVATDQELIDNGYYWKGDLSSLSPSFTINYHLYGKR